VVKVVSRRSRREFLNVLFCTRRFNKEKQKHVISIAYKTGVEVTPRTSEIAEAFGLGVDSEQEFVVYDNLQLQLGEKDVIYITGDSGSGKSVLLKKLEQIFEGLTVKMDDLKVDESKPLVDTIGRTTTEAIELLSRVGLNDAFIFLRKYPELSDGQKYRYKLAKLIESQGKIWICDEFCSLLDRDTAKIVAYNVQKLARKLGKGVFVATCHRDLLEDLKPDVHIHKRFGKEVSVKYHQKTDFQRDECSLLKEIHIRQGSRQDYLSLSSFHYRSHTLPPPRRIFTAVRKSDVIGVIVYSYPPPTCFGRKKVGLGNTTIDELNKKLSNISRVVVHPKYRSIGLGKKLVRETLDSCGTPLVETIAVMAKYNPLFEKAGMEKIAESKPAKTVVELTNKLFQLGFDPVKMASPSYNLSVLKKLSSKEKAKLRQILAEKPHPRLTRCLSTRKPFLSKNKYAEAVQNASLEKIAGLIRIVALLRQTKVYLFWRNPTWRGDSEN